MLRNYKVVVYVRGQPKTIKATEINRAGAIKQACVLARQQYRARVVTPVSCELVKK